MRDNLEKVWKRMPSGSYFPDPVRAVEIPESDGGARVLRIPTIDDGAAQTVAARWLEAAAETRFHLDSFGFRPGWWADGAVRACRDRCWKRRWVVDLDIAGFFDAVDWGLLTEVVGSRGVSARAVLYVRRWLAVEAVSADGRRIAWHWGTPRGSGLAGAGQPVPALCLRYRPGGRGVSKSE
ncbi:reverse transcriptase domain-containing protein [Nocardiopsis rhodophaea]|uniref:reverse transcriptase domain-containing protein n=1 Tax=Nocardiopsis rhodophaea TaxID=280238 RepID=UPI0039EE1C06